MQNDDVKKLLTVIKSKQTHKKSITLDKLLVIHDKTKAINS